MKRPVKIPTKEASKDAKQTTLKSVASPKVLADYSTNSGSESHPTENPKAPSGTLFKPLATIFAVGAFVVVSILAFSMAKGFLFDTGEPADLIDHSVVVAVQSYSAGSEVYEQRGPTTIVTQSLEYAINVSASELGINDENLTHVPYGNWVPVVVDVGPDFVTLDYSHGSRSGNFSTRDFNGYVLNFQGNGKTCSIVEGATINADGTNLALDSSDITFSPHELRINMSSLPYSPSSKVRVDLNLGRCN